MFKMKSMTYFVQVIKTRLWNRRSYELTKRIKTNFEADKYTLSRKKLVLSNIDFRKRRLKMSEKCVK